MSTERPGIYHSPLLIASSAVILLTILMNSSRPSITSYNFPQNTPLANFIQTDFATSNFELFTPALRKGITGNVNSSTVFVLPSKDLRCDYAYNYACKFWFHIRCIVLASFKNVVVLTGDRTTQKLGKYAQDGDVALLFWRHESQDTVPEHLNDLLDWRDKRRRRKEEGRNVRIGVFHVADEKVRSKWTWYPLPDFILRNYWTSELPLHVQYIPLGGQVPFSCPYSTPKDSYNLLGRESDYGNELCRCNNVQLKVASKRKYLWSFSGSLRRSRHILVSLLNSSTKIRNKGKMVLSGKFGGDGVLGDKLSDPRNGYLDIVQESQFVFCPCGNVMETHRIYEALMHGAIPLVEDCEKYRHDFFPLTKLRFQNFNDMVQVVTRHAGKNRRIDTLQRQTGIWWEDYSSMLTRNTSWHILRRVPRNRRTIMK